MNPIVSILLCILLLACGGYFSGTETGMYRVSRFRVRLGFRHHRPLYAILMNLLSDSQGVVLSTLIGANLFCYLSTCLFTYILLHAGATHHAAEAITTLVMTSVSFVYVDIIPKTLFYYRADTLMPLLSGPLWLFHTILTRCGIIAVLKGLSQGLNRLFGSSTDTPTALAMTGRHEVRQILHETREEGFLTPTQQDMLHALIDSQDLRVDSILIPLSKAHMLPVASNRSAVLECLRNSPPERIAVYEKNREAILGWISPSLVAAEHREFSDVRPFLQPIGWIASDLSILDAIDRMADDNLRIAAVRDSRKAKGSETAVVGIVTLRDMVEQVTSDRPTTP
jgi:putative hemolysin